MKGLGEFFEDASKETLLDGLAKPHDYWTLVETPRVIDERGIASYNFQNVKCTYDPTLHGHLFKSSTDSEGVSHVSTLHLKELILLLCEIYPHDSHVKRVIHVERAFREFSKSLATFEYKTSQRVMTADDAIGGSDCDEPSKKKARRVRNVFFTLLVKFNVDANSMDFSIHESTDLIWAYDFICRELTANRVAILGAVRHLWPVTQITLTSNFTVVI